MPLSLRGQLTLKPLTWGGALRGSQPFGDTMKKSDFVKPKEKKIDGKKLDTMKELKKAFSKPTRVAEVGGRGYV
jgi:hypothetical protein